MKKRLNQTILSRESSQY